MKKNQFVSILFFLFFLLNSTVLRAQPFDSILNKLSTEYPQEKLYLHYDKAIYNPGETIWFKAYVLSGYSPSELSKNLYAELIDNKGNLLQKLATPFTKSGAAGSFDLPDNYPDSVVYIRAYTRWMLNFDSSFLYTRAIPIIKAKSPGTGGASTAQQAFLQFFPEGGEMVQDVESRVAFKFTDQNGRPIKANGEIVNSKGAKIASLLEQHDGMGYFSFTPQAGESYKATWKDPSGKVQQTMLPSAIKEGIVLEAKNGNNAILFNVKRRAGDPGKFASVYIVAQMQQQLLYRAKANLGQTANAGGKIPTENFPAGIVQLTAFSMDNKPLAERIIFVSSPDYYFITDLNAAVKGTGKRSKNVIQIDVPDTVACNLSLSVTDAGINPAIPGEPDIFSQLLVTSDIKGYVHNPGYYFSNEADSVLAHLDLVMMTNGWRRFVWDDVLAGKYPKIKEPADDYLAIEGKINGLTKSELYQKQLTAILIAKNENQQILSIPVEADGHFKIDNMLLFDTARIFYQLSNDKNKVLTTKATFIINNSLYNKDLPFSASTIPGVQFKLPDRQIREKNMDLTQRYLSELDRKRKTQVLAGVEVVASKKSKKEKMEEEYTSGLFKGDSYTFITEDDPAANGSQTVLSYLQGKVAGLQISGYGSNMNMSWRGGTPSLYYNEMPSQLDMVQNIPLTDIAMIKVFRPPFFGGFGGGSGGAIAVYTKKGGGSTQNNAKGLESAKLTGYTPYKQFYSPDYTTNENSSEDDFRTTLYWNPFILTDKNNRRIILTFFNNDVTKKFRLVLEGINADGRLTRMEKIIE